MLTIHCTYAQYLRNIRKLSIWWGTGTTLFRDEQDPANFILLYGEGRYDAGWVTRPKTA